MSDEPPLPENQPVKRLTIALLIEEPFRIFFPLAVLAGMTGVALWPLYYGGIIGIYPGLAHARIMMECFFGGMILGFLGTAGPRMLSAPVLRFWELVGLLTLWLAALIAHMLSRIAWGDLAFGLALLLFLVAVISRWRQRQDMPPPGFVLVGIGLFCGFTGATLLFLSQTFTASGNWQGPAYLLGTLFVFQGFVLCPILGVAPFLFGRFGGLENKHDFPESRTPPPGWTPKAVLAALCGALIILSFLLETWSQPILGYALRLLTMVLYIWREIPWRFRPQAVGTLGHTLQLALLCLVAGLAVILFYPAYAVAWKHILFIGGFNLIVITVATRVIFGHSGNGPKTMGKIPFFRVTITLVIVALASRVTADLSLAIRESHLFYAAVFWLMGMAIWALKVLPAVLTPDPED